MTEKELNRQLANHNADLQERLDDALVLIEALHIGLRYMGRKSVFFGFKIVFRDYCNNLAKQIEDFRKKTDPLTPKTGE